MNEKKDCPNLDSGKEPTTSKKETINKALESCEKLEVLYELQINTLREAWKNINKQIEYTEQQKKTLAKQKQQLTKLKENTSAN